MVPGKNPIKEASFVNTKSVGLTTDLHLGCARIGVAKSPRSEEFAPWFARRMRQLPGLIDDATDRVRELGWVSTERLARTPLTSGYGRYIRLAGVYARFDINFDHWAERGDTPLWLWLYNANDLDEDAIGGRLSTYALEKTGAGLSDDWVLPIILPTGEEYETVLRAVVNTLVDVGRAINPDGP